MKININNIYSKVAGFLRSIIQKPKKNVVLGAILVVAFAVTSIGIYMDKNMVYAVKVNNKTIGYVKEAGTYQKALDSIKKSDGETPVKLISTDKVKNAGFKFMNSSEVEKVAREELKLKMPGVIIYADSTEIARVASFDAANKVLDEVKKYYLKQLDYNDYKLISSNIKEKVTTYTTLMEPEKIMDIDETVQKIIEGRGLQKTYTIKKGDTIWDIAFKNGMTVEQIQAANPNMNLDRIQIDQKINLAVSEPYLNVEIVADVKSKEDVPYTEKKVSNSKMYKGDSKITTKGKVGLADVEKNVTILNGDVVHEDVIKSTVITPAVQQVVAVGTKANKYYSSSYVATSSTGTFSWPTRGLITSRYGYRGRELHTGLDIAVPRGTTVTAADSGTVSFAGWNGGYGYCVIINHKNGYQTLYGHNSKLYVKAGQTVSKGQKIAASGSTGRSTGPHVHFEVRKNGVPQNPSRYLS